MSESTASNRSGLPPAPEGKGGEAGSSRRLVLPNPSDNQPTVISQRPPLAVASSASDGAGPFDKWGLMPGDRLGQFELLEFVGGGGMGRVFRAVDTRLARTVALKVLSPDQAADANTVLRFQNEAQSAARLDHQNIARVHYVGEDRGIPFIVFEFIEGVNVRDLVYRKGPLPLGEAVSYLLQVAEGLAHAADRNVVHRDIKPSNILITAEGAAKLIDLGLARLQRLSPRDDLTASGVTLGTFDYISPEQARDPRSADSRSDIYSLGCTLYFMLTGRPPFPEGTVLQKLLQHQADQPPDVRQSRGDLPEALVHMLRKMLAKDPKHRYQKPSEVVEELKGIARQIGLSPPQPGSGWSKPTASRPGAWRRHLPWVVPVCLLLSVSAVLEWNSHGREETPVATPGVESMESGKTDAAKSETKSEPGKADATLPAPPAANPAAEAAPASATAIATASSGDGPATDSAPRLPSPLDLRVSPQAAVSALRPGTIGAGLSIAEPLAARLAVGGGDREVTRLAMAQPDPAAEGAGPLPKPAAKQAGLLVIGDHDADEPSALSLDAAFSRVASGDVIELRYNGRRTYRAAAVNNLALTIRGNEQYQPVIVLQPAEADLRAGSPRMFRVAGGGLTLINVALELECPAAMAGKPAALIEILGGGTLRLERCSLTIRRVGTNDAARSELAFFHLKAPAAADANRAAAAGMPTTSIEIEDTIARGSAVFLRDDAARPVRLTWNNGLLVTESLLAAGGERPSPEAGLIDLRLRHLTAYTRGGLFRLAGGAVDGRAAQLWITACNCIFRGSPDAPLLDLSGTGGAEELKRYVDFNGTRNFYQDWSTFWNIRTADASAPGVQMPFAAWQAYWGPERESRPAFNGVLWKRLPDAAQPLHAQRPADYALDSAPTNPARGAAGDADDAGMQQNQLPRLPAEP